MDFILESWVEVEVVLVFEVVEGPLLLVVEHKVKVVVV